MKCCIVLLFSMASHFLQLYNFLRKLKLKVTVNLIPMYFPLCACKLQAGVGNPVLYHLSVCSPLLTNLYSFHPFIFHPFFFFSCKLSFLLSSFTLVFLQPPTLSHFFTLLSHPVLSVLDLPLTAEFWTCPIFHSKTYISSNEDRSLPWALCTDIK